MKSRKKVFENALIVFISFFFTITVVHSQDSTKRIAFGSCVKTGQGKVWEFLQRTAKPDFFLLLGDSVYLDQQDLKSKTSISKKFDLIYGNTRAGQFVNTTKTHAMWDDHDAGPDNSGKLFSGISETRNAFIDFWFEPTGQLPEISGMLTQKIDGDLYTILLLDGRSQRVIRGASNSTIFGTRQLDWLANEVKHFDKKYLIIASGTPFTAIASKREALVDSPAEYKRLMTILASIKQPVLFISGDRHYGEFLSRRHGGKTFYELISSPLDAEVAREKDVIRFSAEQEIFTTKNVGVIDISEKFLSFSLYSENGERLKRLKLQPTQKEEGN